MPGSNTCFTDASLTCVWPSVPVTPGARSPCRPLAHPWPGDGGREGARFPPGHLRTQTLRCLRLLATLRGYDFTKTLEFQLGEMSTQKDVHVLFPRWTDSHPAVHQTGAGTARVTSLPRFPRCPPWREPSVWARTEARPRLPSGSASPAQMDGVESGSRVQRPLLERICRNPSVSSSQLMFWKPKKSFV